MIDQHSKLMPKLAELRGRAVDNALMRNRSPLAEAHQIGGARDLQARRAQPAGQLRIEPRAAVQHQRRASKSSVSVSCSGAEQMLEGGDGDGARGSHRTEARREGTAGTQQTSKHTAIETKNISRGRA